MCLLTWTGERWPSLASQLRSGWSFRLTGGGRHTRRCRPRMAQSGASLHGGDGNRKVVPHRSRVRTRVARAITSFELLPWSRRPTLHLFMDMAIKTGRMKRKRQRPRFYRGRKLKDRSSGSDGERLSPFRTSSPNPCVFWCRMCVR